LRTHANIDRQTGEVKREKQPEVALAENDHVIVLGEGRSEAY